MADDETKQSREEFQEARRALVDMLAAQHPGTTYQDGDGVKIADLPNHFKTTAEQRANQIREAAASDLGMTPDEYDQFKAARAAEAESTPQSRTANLPSGRPPTVPAKQPANPVEGTGERGPLWGIDKIEQQANEDFAHLFRRD